MQNPLWKDALGWGVGLWAIGYALGIVLFAVLPTALIGWTILPIGVVLTVWVLMTRVKATRLRDYLIIAIAWTLIAVVGDYLFIVTLLAPPDGYYKLDVYLYYALTFALPLGRALSRDGGLHAQRDAPDVRSRTTHGSSVR